MVELTGGKRARIVVCSSPSGDPKGVFDRYETAFRELGAGEVTGALLTRRAEAAEAGLIKAVEQATGVFFTGGDQLRLTVLIGGTEFARVIRSRYETDGLIIGGTSAGAAAMSTTMVTGGPNEGTLRRRDVELAPGLGFWRDTLVDTHFNQRGRVSRLLTVLAQNPEVLGVGIDENTAVEVDPGRRFTVLGAGAVLVTAGPITHTSAAEVGAEETLALTDVSMHVLARGYGFDLRERRPLLAAGPSSGGGTSLRPVARPTRNPHSGLAG
jgi:cyanophycinase